LYGAFNLENVMCALACVHALGIAWADVSPLLSQTSAVAGRMQWVRQSPVVVVDYAHTPDALEKALISLRRHIPEGQLHVVFGAGGDRDAGKRPLMGQIAERCADRVMVTDDNPRTEVPATIAQQILSATPLQMDEVYVPDRQQAICRAIEQASAYDVVLVAGKGHEDYQDVMGERRYFSDVAAVLACR
jgi:UDP-N-acetylmuramyl-tripeptide synthetase